MDDKPVLKQRIFITIDPNKQGVLFDLDGSNQEMSVDEFFANYKTDAVYINLFPPGTSQDTKSMDLATPEVIPGAPRLLKSIAKINRDKKNGFMQSVITEYIYKD